jgi:hypothetical protein
MKTVISFATAFSILALAVVLGVPGLRMFRPAVVRAQTGCSASSLSVPYSYNFVGTFYDNAGNIYSYGDVGVLSADGNGKLTGSDTVSKDGIIARQRTFTGAYTVDGNCTGSAQFQFSDGSNTSMDFSLGNGGKGINFIDTDNNVIVTGTATAQ